MFSVMDESNVRSNPNKHQTVKTYVCLHADTKPTQNIENGSTCLEMDTGDLYIFDKANSLWREL